MAGSYDKSGAGNPNWKGGITSFLISDDALLLPEFAQDDLRNRIITSCVVDDESQCWNWTGPIFKKNGRAKLTLGRKNHVAARLAYVLFKGRTGPLCVLHTCDNPLCVSPDHLWLGTNADNSADMAAKGRAASGDANGSRLYPERLARGDDNYMRRHPEARQGANNPRALLTEEQVREIRRRYIPYVNNRQPSNMKQLAAEFGVAIHVIRLIAKYQTWKNVK